MTDAPSERTRLRRNARRAVYDAATLRAVLDANSVCHVAYVEAGEPRLIPTLYVRQDNYVYLHGNRQSALLRVAETGAQLCVSVTAVYGLVVARSGFHCSMNYGSVVLFGPGEAVPEAEHEAMLDRFVEALVPGHETQVRRPTAEELNATRTVRVAIDEASAKIRTGDPIDDESDLAGDTWAGVIPLRTVAGPPEPAANLKAGIDVPAYIRNYQP